MNVYTVPEVPGSRRNTHREYNVAIIGKRNYEASRDAWDPSSEENKRSGVAPERLRGTYEYLLKKCETPVEDRAYEVLRWSADEKTAQAQIGTFRASHLFIKVVKTEKIK